MSSFKAKTGLYLVAGALLIPCAGPPGALQTGAWAQPQVQPGAALEAQIKAAWDKLQRDSVELEVADPQSAITRYQKFFEEEGYGSAAVGLQISLRIARLYQFDLKNTDKAIEIYDWALTLYKDQPEAIALQEARLAALKFQNSKEDAGGNPALATAQGATPLGVVPPPAGGGLGVNITPQKKGGALGVNITPRTGGGLGVNPFSPAGSKLGITPVTGISQKPLPVTILTFLGRALGWQPGPQRCVTALAQQSDGTLWVATEDSGVWCYDPRPVQLADRWKQFTAKDGLADDSAYALAVDQKGRVWAGTLNHGVSVWNGKEWKNYGVLDGPLGERVFDIAICPTDGDVWIATNAGLTRYSMKGDSWSYVTRADGLPSDQIQAIAFDKSGNIVLGTQCDGVALANAADDYKMWRVVKGAEKMPLTATGVGLPSNLINDVLVARDGTIYVATTTGLAWSSDKGVKWNYVRGGDYADKVKGLFDGAPAGWKEGAGAILAEDYVSCLAEDEAGRLWIGHWKAGSEMVRMQSGPAGVEIKDVPYRTSSGVVKAILPRAKGAILLAEYDQGLNYGSAAIEKNEIAPKVGAVAITVLPPSEAKAPTLNELNTMLASLSKIEPLNPAKPFVTALPDDWTTQGNWLGRYGRYWASLSAMVYPPGNYLWGGGSSIAHTFQISPKQKNDALRYWVKWFSTDNPRSLEMPPTYFDSRLQKGLTTKEQYRRQAEVDDHGEEYPLTKEGPDIYFSVEVPKGLWTLSFYNTNQDGLIRARDYLYSVRPHDGWRPINDVTGFDKQPELINCRQRDFRGGVYKRFLVRGPQQLTIKIAKNNSLNTTLAGAFLDLVEEQPPPYFGTVIEWKKRRESREQELSKLNAQSDAERAARFAPAINKEEAANRLFTEVERLRDLNPLSWAQRSRPIYSALAREIMPSSLKAGNESNTILNTKKEALNQQGSIFYNLLMYNKWEDVQRQLGLLPARDIEKSLKWDGISSDGEGFQVISKYLLSLNSKEPQ